MLLSKGLRGELGSWLVLGGLWLLVVCLDGVWLALDHAVPSWDPADHLIGVLNYSWMMQHAAWLSGDWWNSIWTLSSKYPPLLYISTTPVLALLGKSADAAIAVNLLYTAILLASVYGLGRHLFGASAGLNHALGRSVGLWAAGLCVLFPQFYVLRSQYFMDYPLTALVAAAFYLLTVWKDAEKGRSPGLLTIGFGLVFGLAMLMKQTALLFFVAPLLWLTVGQLWQRQWGRLAQLMVGSLLAGIMMVPWSRVNWLFQISAAFSANTRSADIEGDPEVLSVESWVYYLTHLPQAVSYPLLVVSLVGLLWWGYGVATRSPLVRLPRGCSARLTWMAIKPEGGVDGAASIRRSLLWLAVFWVGAYIVWSSFANKDVRYVMPYLPVLSVILAFGMASWRGRWQMVSWAAVGLSVLLMLTNLLPLGSDRPASITKILTPTGQHRPYLGAPWPHAEIVDELVQTQPYQLMNLGVLPSTPELNQHNLNYYGTLQDFQVYARRMGKSQEHIEQDLRSLDWFISVTRPQLDDHDRKSRQRQQQIARTLRRSPDFQRQRQWDLPDGSRLDLFRRKRLSVEVQPLSDAGGSNGSVHASRALSLGDAPDVRLERVSIPDRVPPDRPVPVTYTWIGSWEALSRGMVLLTWRSAEQGIGETIEENPREVTDRSNSHWLHDHSIGFGTLRPKPIQANQSMLAPAPTDTDRPFRVIERTAMLPPPDTASGSYTLDVLYLDPGTGQTTPINAPTVNLTLDPDANPSPAPDVDWVSQLRQLSTALPLGPDALEPVFDQIGRFSLYDPIQHYTVQAEATLIQRLQQEPDSLDYAYGLVLAQVLQRDAEGAIATLSSIVEQDPQNPYAHAYLAFVNLYALHPAAAQEALKPALEQFPDSKEFRALNGAAALMRGNLWRAWKDGRYALQED